jgi:hypothetical protein
MTSDNERNIPFGETWGFPNDIKNDLKASWYETVPSPDTYASGRPKLMVRFYGAGYGASRPLIAERDGMELISKKTGKPYIVCRRKAIPPVITGILKRPKTMSPIDLSSLYEALPDEVPPIPLARTQSVAQ